MILDRLVNLIRYLFKNSIIHRSNFFLKFYNLYSKKINKEYIGKEKIQIHFEGINFLINTDKTGLEPSIISGSWEKKELKIFKTKIIQCDSLVDVGANVGIYSLIGLRVNPKLKNLIAIEPHPESYSILKENLLMCSTSDTQLSILNKAVSEQNGFAELVNYEIPAATRVINLQKLKDSSAKFNVEVINLDSLIDLFDPISRIFIKIDVEGLEPSIISGGEMFIKKFKPKILFELSSENISKSNDRIDKAIEILESTYKIINVIGPRKTINSPEIAQTLLRFTSKPGIFSVYLE